MDLIAVYEQIALLRLQIRSLMFTLCLCRTHRSGLVSDDLWRHLFATSWTGKVSRFTILNLSPASRGVWVLPVKESRFVVDLNAVYDSKAIALLGLVRLQIRSIVLCKMGRCGLVSDELWRHLPATSRTGFTIPSGLWGEIVGLCLIKMGRVPHGIMRLRSTEFVDGLVFWSWSIIGSRR